MNKKSSLRDGFTLIELLLVISILTILASLAVGVMSSAQNDAAIASTRSRMNVIRQILEVELEDYEVRRSPISFAGLDALVNLSTLDSPGAKQLLHIKNLKRMIIADMIRTELPDGSGTSIGAFPSAEFGAYLTAIGITPVEWNNVLLGQTAYQDRPESVVRWSQIDRWNQWISLSNWSQYVDSNPNDDIDEAAADKAELLHAILSEIDLDGISAIEQLGNQAVGDSDGDGILEIVDAWGEPLFLQWQQEWMTRPAGGGLVPPIELNEWQLPVGSPYISGLSREHPSFGRPAADYSKPVLPTQIRPFLVSQRLVEVDGVPIDYQRGEYYPLMN